MSHGGGIYIGLANRDIAVDGCTLKGNRAGYGGGAYMNTQNDITVRYNVFRFCVARKDGGAVYSDSYNQISVQHTNFSSNTAGGDGGAVMLSSDHSGTVFAYTDFSGNRAAGSGGAISVTGTGNRKWNVAGCTLTNNCAGSAGGGMYAVQL